MKRTLYWHPLSGHAHRAQLFCKLLGLEIELSTVDLAARAQKDPAFLAMNPFGQVPVLDDGGTIVSDSNAILVYLAERYDPDHRWYPADLASRAHVQRWLSVASHELARGAASARVHKVFGRELDYGDALDRATSLLTVIDNHLEGRSWLVGDGPTIADLAHYTYVAHAPEGGVDLEPYLRIREWLKRIEALDGFVAMKKS